jgi:hypothetical protein
MIPKRIFLACCLLVFLGGWTFGENTRRGLDGALWKRGTPFWHSLYVAGFVEGYQEGEVDGASIAYAKMVSQPPPVAPDSNKGFLDLAAQAKKHSVISSHTVGQTVEEMNVFYRDVRNAPVSWADAVVVLPANLDSQGLVF